MDKNVYKGQKRPVNGNGDYYMAIEYSSYKDVMDGGFKKDEYFKNAGKEDSYSVYIKVAKEEYEFYHEYEKEVARSEYNEDAIFRCQVTGERKGSIKCTGNCKECEYRNLKSPSLNKVYEDEDGNKYEFGDTIADSNANVEDGVINNIELKRLQKILDGYSVVDREIILSKDQPEESQSEVFRRLGIAPSTGRDRYKKLMAEVEKKMLG